MPDPGLFPIAGELEGALADWSAEGLVRREGGETFGLRVDLGSQDANRCCGRSLLWPVSRPRHCALTEGLLMRTAE